MTPRLPQKSEVQTPAAQTTVDVLIRPEGLHLRAGSDAGNGALSGRVEAARLLGRTSLVHLSVDDGAGGDLHLHARMPGQFLPAEQSHVTIALDPAQAFVFPSGDTR